VPIPGPLRVLGLESIPELLLGPGLARVLGPGLVSLLVAFGPPLS